MQSRQDAVPSDDRPEPDGASRQSFASAEPDHDSYDDARARALAALGGDRPDGADGNGWYGDSHPTAASADDAFGPGGTTSETIDLGAPAAESYGTRPSLASRLMTQIRRPALVVNLVLAALVLAGGGFTYLTVAGKGSTTPTASNSGIRVAARMATVTQTASASGTVQSSDVVTANFTTGG
ncbi:MAG TPA: hypothetical protein VH442_03385, partial [Micromonosporaceae bacterium]